jgi:hypothetical protein
LFSYLYIFFARKTDANAFCRWPKLNCVSTFIVGSGRGSAPVNLSEGVIGCDSVSCFLAVCWRPAPFDRLPRGCVTSRLGHLSLFDVPLIFRLFNDVAAQRSL